MIKIAELIKEPCNECGRDWNHGHDHEAGMAKNELRDMISNASKIDSMVGESDNLPGWVSAYISLAADYMHSVSEYLAGESSRMDEPGPGYSEALNEDSSKDPSILNHFINRTSFVIRKLKGPSDDPLEIIKYKAERVNNVANEYISGKITNDSLKKSAEDEKELNKKAHDFGQKYDDYTDWMTGGGYGEYDEGKKPSAGLTKKQKSAVSKKAHAGKDIGKKGKGFEKLAKAAGGGEKGEKIAAAAMWKNIKR